MKKISEVFGGFDRTNETKESHSCCCGGGHRNHQMSNPDSLIVYQCPMKCEGDKTYSAPGICPICNMHLAPVNEIHLV